MASADAKRPSGTPRLLVMDVDSTLTQTEGIDLLAQIAGVGGRVAGITAQAMRGDLDFSSSLAARVALLAGLPRQAVDEANQRVKLTEGAEQLCARLHEQGWRIGVVSGGLSLMVYPLVQRLGLDHWRANTLEIIDGHLTGQLIGDVISRHEKAVALGEWAAEDGVAMGDTVAMGDGANDIEMIQAAGFGVAFHAKPSVNEAADCVISQGPLTDVLPWL